MQMVKHSMRLQMRAGNRPFQGPHKPPASPVILTAESYPNEQLVRRLVKKVTVYENKAVVEFKSGLKTDVEL